MQAALLTALTERSNAESLARSAAVTPLPCCSLAARAQLTVLLLLLFNTTRSAHRAVAHHDALALAHRNALSSAHRALALRDDAHVSSRQLHRRAWTCVAFALDRRRLGAIGAVDRGRTALLLALEALARTRQVAVADERFSNATVVNRSYPNMTAATARSTATRERQFFTTHRAKGSF